MQIIYETFIKKSTELVLRKIIFLVKLGYNNIIVEPGSFSDRVRIYEIVS